MLQVVFLWHPKTYLPYRRWAVGLVGLRNLAAPAAARVFPLSGAGMTRKEVCKGYSCPVFGLSPCLVYCKPKRGARVRRALAFALHIRAQ